MLKRRSVMTAAALLFGSFGAASAVESTSFNAYVDSDLCSHLMAGPVSDKRIECSQKTHKEGSEPVLVRLQDSLILQVNKAKLVKKEVGSFVEASGEVKENAGRVKLDSVKAIDPKSLTAAGSQSPLLDVRQYRTSGDRVYEQIRHELAMMPYITEFDFISFAMNGDHVILTGWTIRTTNRSTAYNLVKRVEGVGSVTNNITVLPLGPIDMRIRASARARLQQYLSRYFWGNGSDIKIIVNNGDIILLGTVARKADSDLAYIQCNTVPGAFKVFNLLRVSPDAK